MDSSPPLNISQPPPVEPPQRAEFQLLVEHAPVGLALADTQLRYTYINRYLAELNGIAAADHIGRTPLELFPSQQLRWVPYWQQVLQHGEPLHAIELSDQSGEFAALVSYLPLRGPDGAVAGVASVVLNVTPERRRAETLALLHGLLQNAPVGITFFDTNLRYLMISDDLAAINGHPPAAHIGRTVAEMAPYAFALVDETMRAVRDTGVPQTITISHGLPSDPEAIGHWLVTFYPLRRADGQLIGVGGVRMNISALKRAEAERALLLEREQESRAAAERAALQLLRLQEVTAAFAEAISSETIGAIFLDHALPILAAQGGGIGIINASRSALDLLCTRGYDPALVAQFQVTPLDAPVPYAEVPRTGQPFWCERWEEMVARYPTVAGLEPEVGAGASIHLPLLGSGQTLGVAVIQFGGPRSFSEQDRLFVTLLARQCAQALERAQLYAAERRARETAEAAVRLRDEFLSVAAHEFRSPLTALLGQAYLLEQRLRRADQLSGPNERALGVITAQAQRLAGMITDLLDISRLESGQLQIAAEQLDLRQLVQQVVSLSSTTLTSHVLHYQAPDTPVLVRGDKTRLEQVLQNLIANAAKYSAEGSSVVVGVEQQQDEAWLLVRDSGIGIPPEALSRLFERFYRVPGTQQQIEGVGVGLYVVAEIVRLHGGRVDVHSVVDQGSVFIVKLPRG